MKVNSALIGRAGELLVAAELLRLGIEIANPARDVGVDILAYQLHGHAVASYFVPVQVKAASGTGYAFEKVWFEKAPGIVLVQVWHVQTVPEFYVFDNLKAVEDALGPRHVASPSWRDR
ncbi:MAG TPA: hypothetical protein VMH92_11095, partial [Acidocella sp.]|nr:hypothetical protein [Acidocella sp.]